MTRRISSIFAGSVAFASVVALLVASAAGGEQLRTLGAPDGERFPLTDKVWPAQPGEAHVCLWKGDAMGAVSITIDDNTRPDHEWWAQTMAAYGVNVTWFVITCLVDVDPGYRGTWEGFGDLHAMGHDIQSHTVTHLAFSRGFDPDDPDHGIVAEYRDSLAAIEANIPGGRVLTLAYPGGANTGYNDETVADDYYIAARGTVGKCNMANQINWMRTNSVSGQLKISNPGKYYNQLMSLFDDSQDRRWYRGWYCSHYHGLDDAQKAQIIEALDWLAVKDAEVGVWIGTFREVALYGQSRDSATLTVTEAGAERIVFTLTDRMDDTLYTYPLTIKVRLFDDWTEAHAVQDGEAVNVEIVEHDGGRFALVDAVADRGPVELTATAPARPGDADGDGDVDLGDFVILKNHFGLNQGATAAEGDFDGDGDVDLGDFVIFKNHFGATG